MKSLKYVWLFLLLFFSMGRAYSQGAMIVQDPTAIAQSAAQFCDEMSTAVDQKTTLLKQMHEMLAQSKMMKENAEKFKKCMKWVKNARSVIELLNKVSALKDNYVAFYNQVKKCDYLNKSERKNLIYNANIIVSESAEIYEEAKTIVGEFTGDGDAGLSSYERIQLLEQMGTKIEALNGKLEVMKSYTERKVTERQRLMGLSAALINQYCPSENHISVSVSSENSNKLK